MTQLVNKANDCKWQWRVLSAFVSATTAASLSQLNDCSVSLISSRFASVQSNDFKIWRKIDRMKTNCFAACYQSKTLHSSWNNGKLSIQLKGLWSFNSVNTKDPHQNQMNLSKNSGWFSKSAILATCMDTQVSCSWQNQPMKWIKKEKLQLFFCLLTDALPIDVQHCCLALPIRLHLFSGIERAR